MILKSNLPNKAVGRDYIFFFLVAKMLKFSAEVSFKDFKREKVDTLCEKSNFCTKSIFFYFEF